MSPQLLDMLRNLLDGTHGSSLAGTASSLGASGTDLQSILGSFRGFSRPRPFGSDQELHGGFAQIADLQKQLAESTEEMQRHRERSASLISAYEDDPKSFYHSPQQGMEERTRLLEREQQHQQESRAAQEQIRNLQSRIVATQNPRAAAGVSRMAAAGRLGVAAVGTQLAGAFVQNRVVEPATNMLGFAGGTAGTVAGQMAGQGFQSATNVASGAMAGASAGMMLGPEGAAVGAVIGALASASTEMIKMPTRIKDWSESLLASQQGLAKFSGTLSRAFAQREISQIRRDITSAQATGGSTAELSDAMNKLYEGIRPLKDQLTVATASVLRELVTLISRNIPLIETGIQIMAAMGDQLTFGTAHLKDLLEASKESIRLKKKSADMEARRRGAPITAAIAALQAEDPTKPRQAPRR